jgi:catechol 2,3-dioxygenase-like lactoylglutathione lyase family enzyme
LIRQISELALWVHDLDVAVAFYREKLGFEVEEYDAGHNAFLRSGDFLLVLFNRVSPGSALGDAYLKRTGGPRGELYHAAFRLDPAELDPYAESLKQKGLEVSGPIEFATGRRSYFLEDPDEHYLELTDR